MTREKYTQKVDFWAKAGDTFKKRIRFYEPADPSIERLAFTVLIDTSDWNFGMTVLYNLSEGGSEIMSLSIGSGMTRVEGGVEIKADIPSDLSFPANAIGIPTIKGVYDFVAADSSGNETAYIDGTFNIEKRATPNVS